MRTLKILLTNFSVRTFVIYLVLVLFFVIIQCVVNRSTRHANKISRDFLLVELSTDTQYKFGYNAWTLVEYDFTAYFHV